MCGIVGIITARAEGLATDLGEMNDALFHRGPDEAGSLAVPGEGVGIAMRRLTILDLAGGQQPMWDEARRHAVVFNGEIYNAAALREQLVRLGHSFASDHSDTEVLVHGYEEWGEALFPKLNGMFAFIIWDRDARRLVVARDRMGEKPLYIAEIPGGFAIASELKGILRHPGVQRELDLAGLEQFLGFDYILGPRTILRHVKKLPAAHYAVIGPEGYESRPYWTLEFDTADKVDESMAVERLDTLLDESVKLRMVADVPVGLFLSGGLDSTTVGYYMRRHSSQVRSFSIGFEDKAYDESEYAALASRHLGTHHHLEMFSEDRVRALVPAVADVLDEPMADVSIFPTYLLSRVTRPHVKVALGGDGSDELLMGYKAYQALKLSWAFDPLPAAVRNRLAVAARRLPLEWAGVSLKGKRVIDFLDVPPRLRLLSWLGAFHGDSRWVMAADLRDQLTRPLHEEVMLTLGAAATDSMHPAEATISAYVRAYLQEDILVKVDRASMAASLEVRAPFLDPQLITFLAGVPSSMKMKGLKRKYLLQRLMRGRIPDVIIDRPKRGFGVPMNSWLRGPLAPLLHDYLDSGRITLAGILDAPQVTRLVDEHLAGRGDHGAKLWSLLLFELWRERWLGAGAEAECERAAL